MAGKIKQLIAFALLAAFAIQLLESSRDFSIPLDQEGVKLESPANLPNRPRTDDGIAPRSYY